MQTEFDGFSKKGYRWKRTRQSQHGKQNLDLKASKQADLATLMLAAQEGHIDLKYGDESGFCLASPVSYSYSKIGTQKRLEQWKTVYGSRLSILGIWQPNQSFDYALVQGSFSKERYVKVMNWVAQRAAQTLSETGRLTVVVQDNGSSHTSHWSRSHWRGGKNKVYICFSYRIAARK